LAFCWAQVRRDFIEAARRYPPHQDWMFTWVEAIRELYRINKQRVGEWNRERPLDQQSAAFERHHQALIAALSALEQRRDEALRQSDLPDPQRAVLTSLKTHWGGLTVFVTHPQVPMDNNSGERGVRKGVLGRNAYHGSGSQWSAHLMAAMLTLLQTLVHWGINAHHWMTAFLCACAGSHGVFALGHERGTQASAQPTAGDRAEAPHRVRLANTAVLRRYCGRDFACQELALIRRLIAEAPTATRADLSRQLCERIGWYKADGGLKEMSARVAMLRMQEDGLIVLPQPTGARPQSHIRATPATAPGPPIELAVQHLARSSPRKPPKTCATCGLSMERRPLACGNMFPCI